MNVTVEHEEGNDSWLPDAYPQHCLWSSSSSNDSLLLLAKEVFKKISRKQSSTKISSLTSIQSICWPIMKKSEFNLVAISSTGSGKTLAYVVPMIDSCLDSNREGQNFIHGLVIVPTRELAIQVSKTMKLVAKLAAKVRIYHDHHKLVTLAIYGGVDRNEQIESLLRGGKDEETCFLIAATPMRLIDLLGLDCESKLDERCQSVRGMFAKMKIVVIDEGDRCAIASDISRQCDMILNFLKCNCKSLKKCCLFSATLPMKSLEKCHEWIMKPRVVVKIDTVTVGTRIDEISPQRNVQQSDLSNSKTHSQRSMTYEHQSLDFSLIPKHITQILHVCSNHKKPKKLLSTIQKIREAEVNENTKRRKGLIIVFFGRIKTLEYIHNLCLKENSPCVAFHSKMSQEKREVQLNLFRCGKVPILLATDIAARGLHCNNVEYIINYDFPCSIEQYVHRCGRSGRNRVNDESNTTEGSFMKATVYSFFHRELAPLAKDVVGLLRSTNSWVDPNLIELIPVQERSEEIDESNISRRKRRKKNQSAVACNSTKDEIALRSDLLSDADDDFAGLSQNRITLQRASHVHLSSDDESES